VKDIFSLLHDKLPIFAVGRMSDSWRSDESRPASGGPGEITRLLSESVNGRRSAIDEIMSLVYDDLKRIAHRRLQYERTGHTLDTNAVVHEAYMKLVKNPGADWRNRAHFFAAAARVIRNVVVDYARQRGAQKRGGQAIRVPLREDVEGNASRALELLALDDALLRLARHDERLESVVVCKFFGGMAVPETAEALGVSVRTVERDWARARAYLYSALEGEPPAGD
jgi:RNA polymerase sigma factor (TIGR02999 family)